jgi:hypothetical protein
VFYGRETLPFTLREAHRLTAFEKRVLRKIFGPEREDMVGGWRKCYNEEILSYCAPHRTGLILG